MLSVKQGKTQPVIETLPLEALANPLTARPIDVMGQTILFNYLQRIIIIIIIIIWNRTTMW